MKGLSRGTENTNSLLLRAKEHFQHTDYVTCLIILGRLHVFSQGVNRARLDMIKRLLQPSNVELFKKSIDLSQK